MKTSIFNFKFFSVLCLTLTLMACSEDEDDNSGPQAEGENPDMPMEPDFQTVSQDKVDQEFFIEAIDIVGPDLMERVRSHPHTSNNSPTFGVEFMTQITGADFSDLATLTIRGQRLSSPTVSGRDMIGNHFQPSIGFDYTHILFSFDQEGDALEPNALLTIDTEIGFSPEVNDPSGQINNRITAGKLTITPMEGIILNEVSAGAVLQIMFESNEAAFVNPSDGTVVVDYVSNPDKTYETFGDFFDNKLGNLSVGLEQPINIFLVSSSISGNYKEVEFYGL